MATKYIHRVFMIVPSSKLAQVQAYWKAAIDPVGGQASFSAGLSASGAAPATGYALCGAFTADEFKLVVQQACTLAGLAFPSNWDAMTPAQQRGWVVSQYANLRGKPYLKWFTVDDNTAAWTSYAADCAAAGFKPLLAGAS